MPHHLLTPSMQNPLNSAQTELELYRSPERAIWMSKVRSLANLSGCTKFNGAHGTHVRKMAQKHAHILTEEHFTILLQSDLYEERLLGILCMVYAYPERPELIYSLYLQIILHLGCWKLIDASAHTILGEHLLHQDRSPLYQLSDSENWWERRIAIIATLAYIRRKDYTDTLKLARHYLCDRHDLIRKATGLMLREVGKRSYSELERFVSNYRSIMHKTTLGYAARLNKHLIRTTRTRQGSNLRP